MPPMVACFLVNRFTTAVVNSTAETSITPTGISRFPM